VEKVSIVSAVTLSFPERGTMLIMKMTAITMVFLENSLTRIGPSR
jgi:hypothetical protein